MATQLSFDLPVRTAHGRDDFFISPANAMAVAMIDVWQNWAGRKLVLIGPAGAGKTHLAHVWAEMAKARIVKAADLAALDEAGILALAQSNLAIEDIPDIKGNPAAQRALFHLHNLALAEGRTLLFTARNAPQHWGVELPDLTSRMMGTQAAILEAPDDTLLAALLAKLFHDRQLTPPPDTIPYLTLRMDRSFAAAHLVVAAMDKAALEQSRPLGRKLAGEVLDKLLP
ncbi:MAG: DnaA/Hda family protein [Rhodobacterales bacterium]|nr:DnaA/Hda family protein [Rhodobacterales bacterium]